MNTVQAYFASLPPDARRELKKVRARVAELKAKA